MLKAILVCCALTAATSPAFGQATARPCPSGAAAEETPGPACLAAHAEIGALSDPDVYWHIDTFADRDAAEAARTATGTVVESFGKVWLFTIGPKAWRAGAGAHQADIGPLPVGAAPVIFSAEYLRSTFSPGMTAPLHVHSGPEAFYAVTGNTCLETPDGVQVATGPGNHLFIRGGPPMLLMATGTETRRGFALILHDGSQPPTTMIHDWTPKGLCSGH